MEIIPIFETQNQALYSVKYPDHEIDEFDWLFDLWQDITYLEVFFNSNKSDLGFFDPISIEDAVMQTRSDAKELQKQILAIKDSDEKNSKFLNSHFIPLDNITYKPDELEKCKAYTSIIKKGWIRLYAIRVPENSYVITGGAIKLTRTMMERQHTQRELQKLNNCMDFLRSQGIFDEAGLKD